MRIFFDVDGVLINNIHMTRGWIDRWDKDIEKDLGVSSEKFQGIFKDWFPDVQTGKLDFQQEMDKWLKANHYDVDARTVIDYWNEKDMNFNEDLWPAIRDLSQNKDIHIYAATNQSHERARYLQAHANFQNHFKKVFYSADLGCFKTNPDYYRQIEEELKFDPHQEPPLFFDDDARNINISSARGWDAVLFDSAKDVVNHPLIQRLVSP